MESRQKCPIPDNCSAALPLHRLLSSGCPPEQSDEQRDDSVEDESRTEEADIGDEDSTADSSVSIISVWKPHGKGPSPMTVEHYTKLPRRSTRERKQVKPFVSYEPPAPKPKRARTTTTAQTEPPTHAQSVSVQSASEPLAPQSGPTPEAARGKEQKHSDSDSFEILPTPEPPPIEYYEIADSPPHTALNSSAHDGVDVVTISSGSDDVSGVVSGVDSCIHNDSALSTVHVNDERSVASDVSDLRADSTAPQILHPAAFLVPLTPILAPTVRHTTQLTTIPQSLLSNTLHTLTTLTNSAIVTPSTQLLGSTSSTTPLHIPPYTSLHTLLPTQAPPLPTTSMHTTACNTTTDEPQLELPYIHTESRVRIYVPTVSDFWRVNDFLNLALTPDDISRIRAICATTPIAVCRNMSFPSLPSHYLCLDLSREPLSVRYFWKLLHKAHNHI